MTILFYYTIISIVIQISSESSDNQQLLITSSDLVVNDSENYVHTVLEAYKASLNDQIIALKEPINYSQLKWFSYGAPKLITINDTLFNFNSHGFVVYIETLTNQHKNLLVNEIKKQYNIDVDVSQIKDLIPTAFECVLELKCYEEFQLKGRVKNLREFPLRVDFDLESKQKECLTKLIGESEFRFECTMHLTNAKNNGSAFKKMFYLNSNQTNDILFDETLLERVKHLEAKLNRLTEIYGAKSIDSFDLFDFNCTLNMTNSTNTTSLKKKTLSKDATYKVTQTLLGHTDGVLCLGLLDNGYLMSGSDDSSIRIWNAQTGSLIRRLTGHTSYILCITKLKNGDIASGSFDQTIKIWDPISGHNIRTLYGHTSYVNSIVGLLDGNLASGSYDTTIRIWNSMSGSTIRTLFGHVSGIKSLYVLPNGYLVSGGGSGDNTIKIWNVESGFNLRTLTGHLNSVNCLAILPNGNLISGGGLGDNQINVWNIEDGSIVKQISNQLNDVNSLVVLRDGSIATASTDKMIRIWNITNGKLIKNMTDHTWVVTSLVVLKDGNLASSSLDRTIKIWDTSKNVSNTTL